MNKTIIKSILSKDTRCLKSPKISDFSCVGEIDGVSFEDLVPISFNNLVCLFISRKQLYDVGIENVEDLIGKNVTYGILLPNGAWLFGHTSDVGERFHTYTKDARSKQTRFFEDLRKFGRGLVVIFKIGNKEDSKYWEGQLIKEYKKSIFKEKEPNMEINEFSTKEINEITSEFIYNINNF